MNSQIPKSNLTLEDLSSLFMECFDSKTPPQYLFNEDEYNLFARVNYLEDFKKSLIQSGNCQILVNQAYKTSTQIYSDYQMSTHFKSVLNKIINSH